MLLEEWALRVVARVIWWITEHGAALITPGGSVRGRRCTWRGPCHVMPPCCVLEYPGILIRYSSA